MLLVVCCGAVLWCCAAAIGPQQIANDRPPTVPTVWPSLLKDPAGLRVREEAIPLLHTGLAGLGLGAGAAVGSLGAAIGITSARQELGLILRWASP